MNKQITINYTCFDSIHELTAADKMLVELARETTNSAYAPYSKFHVGAIAKLTNGYIAKGSNQENVSYPVCMCAEQTLVLGLVNELNAGNKIETIAVSYNTQNGRTDIPASPCGKCRQFLFEFETRQKQNIRIIMSGMSGAVHIVDSVADLLPFAFNSEF
ncbi:cytidine deaminase [Aquella oligotrophica]|uniref:Cytidine deaminase n=1 Tax=Aquella oligotrophica TaxID=2067065 RepID=A0A2I7N3B5_9NEIS|nr:cytidine deaminase [Aquella oligotrophica]AUR50940.1 cytidine deaminase [Aquella oligotrophica]